MNWQSLIHRFRKFLAENVKFHPNYFGAFQLGNTSLRINPSTGYMILPGSNVDCMGYAPGQIPDRNK